MHYEREWFFLFGKNNQITALQDRISVSYYSTDRPEGKGFLPENMMFHVKLNMFGSASVYRNEGIEANSQFAGLTGYQHIDRPQKGSEGFPTETIYPVTPAASKFQELKWM